ncbi:MAG: PDZ domain-containing protein [Oscillospiraceae bacterium]|nr:PDZ domain-containing protein [Oscillospiraceae bacterium]
MKKHMLTFASYLLVATLSAFLALQFAPEQGKLSQLEGLIEERFIGEAETKKLEDAAAAAMVSATGDRWSYYMSAEEYESYRDQVDNSYVGIGVTIQLEREEGYRIIEVAATGPAAEAGIQVGDLLVEVEDQSIRDMEITAVRGLVKGKEGTYVKLRLLRKGEMISASVERRKVETPVATFEMLENNVGLVSIENFDSRCAGESIAAIETLLSQGAEAIIFDVRNNPGGYADELVELLDYLLPEGDLFRTVRYDGKEHVDTSDAECVKLPMAVLINSRSYSAAEFFAAAMAEYDAAIVIGQQTVGKGYFQTTYPLKDGSAVALSIGKYFTPNGVSLAEEGGLTPEILIELDEETDSALYYGTLSREDDPHIQAAIKKLT